MSRRPKIGASRPFENLGLSLKLLRMERALRQEDLAELCGVGTTLISTYESGRGNPRISTLEKLLVGLDADLLDLADALARASAAGPTSSRVRNPVPRLQGAREPRLSSQALQWLLANLSGMARQ